jgi:hypothetical protein
MRMGAARRQSVARTGLETGARRQVAGRAGFLGLRTLADLRGAVGRIAIGLPAGAATARTGSGSGLNWARHDGDSCDFLATMQAVTRSTLGISELHSRKASLVQACSCSGV